MHVKLPLMFNIGIQAEILNLRYNDPNLGYKDRSINNDINKLIHSTVNLE